ncbi:XdhC family protein [Cognatishimia sp. D5M38]|uniref:XdhC family protein n=1 Tax=Cognatishimia coralii TaxID=3083254 RepID=A0ABU8QFS6_9RHOB
MAPLPIDESSSIAPVLFLAETSEPAVLAVITDIEGPSYRPLGAMMALTASVSRVGSLSSGCVEADIALHAERALEANTSKVVRYGRGSPFVDIQLPCGGGLEITLIPNPDRSVLQTVAERFADRQPCSLSFDLGSRDISVGPAQDTGINSGRFHIRLDPEIYFYVFGKGPEAVTFAALVQSAGFPNVLCSPDHETLEAAANGGSETRHLTSARFPADFAPDARSAVVLFFHDHDWEPEILKGALASKAFYIGAQGSKRSAAARRAQLTALGTAESDLERLRGPIGLIPSARDARKLAVSVLAEVMNEG